MGGRWTFTAEDSKKGGLARIGALTQEQRNELASYAAQVRWAQRREVGVYPRRGDALKRIDYHLRALDRLMGRALMEKDYGEARRCIQSMLGFERMKIWVMDSQGKAGGLALEMEPESERKLIEARERREKALGLKPGEEIVEAELTSKS